MKEEISKTQTAKILAAFIRYADEKGSIDQKDKDFFQKINSIIPNGNILESHLYELNDAGIISYEEIGEDGFAPIILSGCTKSTADKLSTLLDEMDHELKDLRQRISEILTFDPERLKRDISGAETQLKNTKKLAEDNEILKPLLRQIYDIERHLAGVSIVAEKYEEVYKNIIRPVQLEGESGVKATVRWAIISIVFSTLISVALGNWKDFVEIFKKFC